MAMRLNPADKMCGRGKIEKHILREAFEDLLPHEVAWRQKEQFSDGVGYSWIDSLKAMVEEEVTDQMFEAAAFRFPRQHPLTKEAYYYRAIFDEHFPLESAARTVPTASRSPAPPRPRWNGMPVQRWPTLRSRRDGRPPAGLLIAPT